MTSAFRFQLRRSNVLLVRAMVRDWPMLDVTRLDETFPGWLAAARRAVGDGRVRALSLTREYLGAAKAAAGQPRPAVVADPQPVSPGREAMVLAVVSVIAIKAATARGVPPVDAGRAALVMTTGEASRLALAASRDMTTASAVADPDSRGWRRVGDGGCAFCAMLIGRGAVYTEAGVDFASHAHCTCSAEPVFEGVDGFDVESFVPTVPTITPTDRARVRRWISKHDAG